MRGSAGANVRIEGTGLNESARNLFHQGEEDETLENPAEATPPLVSAPRHLRRRRLHGEIPDALLVPGAEPFALHGSSAATSHAVNDADVPAKPKSPRSAAGTGRKRTVALLIVLLVSLSIPALLLALILAG
jgi:hypothetical protein